MIIKFKSLFFLTNFGADMTYRFLPTASDRIPISSIGNLVNSTATMEELTELITQPPPDNTVYNRELLNETLTVDVAAELNVFFGSSDTKFNRRLMVYEFIHFIDLPEHDPKIRWGYGVRCRLNILKNEASANIDSIPMVAFSAEAKRVSVSARIQTIGINNPKIDAALPKITTLDLTSFADLHAAFNHVIPPLINEDATEKKPRILAIFGKSEDPIDRDAEYMQSLATGWALTRIMKGDSLNEAQLEYERANPLFNSVVKSVYIDITKTPNTNAAPDDIARLTAKRILNGLQVKN